MAYIVMLAFTMEHLKRGSLWGIALRLTLCYTRLHFIAWRPYLLRNSPTSDANGSASSLSEFTLFSLLGTGEEVV